MRRIALLALVLALGRVAPVAMRHAVPTAWSFHMDAACQWYPRPWLQVARAAGIFYTPAPGSRAAQVQCYEAQGVAPFVGPRASA